MEWIGNSLMFKDELLAHYHISEEHVKIWVYGFGTSNPVNVLVTSVEDSEAVRIKIMKLVRQRLEKYLK